MASANRKDRDQPAAAPVNAWLRRHLGRRLTVVVVAPSPLDDETRRLADALAAYEEIHVSRLPAEHTRLEQHIAGLASLDPEIVLVAASTEVGAISDEQVDEIGLRALLDELERAGIRDRAFVALVGPNVTRERARRLGCEDGFAAGTPLHELAVALSREGVAVDERRQRGSSPPCYL